MPTPLELESLFVRIYADATSYFRTIAQVKAATTQLASSIGQLGGSIVNNATSAFTNLAGSFRGLAMAAHGVSTSLMVARLSLAGFVAYSVTSFKSLDEILVRTMGHMRDFGGTNRQALQAAVFGVASQSITSPYELAKSMDLLVSSGMNAAMATRALANAESFAATSGMEMGTATKHLIGILRATGLDTLESYHTNMVRLSDDLVAVARLSGTTEHELANAMSGRFITAMKMGNMTLEEGIGLLGVYAKQLPRLGGAELGDIANRAIMEITSKSTGHRGQWELFFGKSFFDATNKMKPIGEVIDILSERLAGFGTDAQAAQLSLLGFEQRAIAAILPLLGTGKAIRDNVEQMKKMQGVTEEIAKMLRESFSGQVKILWNNLTVLATTVGERLAPVLLVLTTAVVDMIQAFTRLNPAYQNLIVMSALIVTLAYPALMLLRYAVGLLVSTVLAPLRLLASLLMLLASIILSVGMGLLSFAMSIPGMLYGLAKTTTSVAYNMYVVFMVPFRGLLYVVENIGTWLDRIGTAFWEIGSNAGKLLMQGLVGIGSILLSIIIWVGAIAVFLAMLPLIFTAIAVGGAAIAAVVVTLGIGLYQLGAMLGGGIIALWAAFKTAVGAAFAWTAGKIKDMNDGVVTVWNDIKNGAAGAFRTIGEAITRIAGFLWNFRENVKKIGEWLKENWEPAIRDIGTATAMIIENLVTNIMSLFSAIGSSLLVVLMPVGNLIIRLFTDVFTWITTNWDRMWSDAMVAFRVFVGNMAHNFTQLFPLIDALANYVHLRLTKFMYLDALGTYNARERESKLAIGEEVKRITDPDYLPIFARREFKGPFDGMGKMQTRWGDLPGRFGDTFGMAGDAFGGVGGKIGGIFGTMAEGMKALLGDDFKPEAGWDKLLKSLNLNLPEGGLPKMLEKYLGGGTPFLGGGEGGPMLGGGGPGFTFKQISTERYMVGGGAAERLDYQQLVVLKSLDTKMGKLLEAKGEGFPAAPPPPRLRD